MKKLNLILIITALIITNIQANYYFPLDVNEEVNKNYIDEKNQEQDGRLDALELLNGGGSTDLTTVNENIANNSTRLDSKDIVDNSQNSKISNNTKSIESLKKSLINERKFTRKLVNKATSMTIAMSSSFQFQNSNRSFNFAVGAYNNEYAISSGIAFKIKQNTVISMKIATDSSFNVGASIAVAVNF